MVTAAILFAIAALGGVVMATMRLRGKPQPPIWLAALHGIVAASGLVTLIVTVAHGEAPTAAKVALAGFAIAALGGSFLFLAFHLKQKPLPVPIMFIHGTAAVISFIILLTAICGV